MQHKPLPTSCADDDHQQETMHQSLPPFHDDDQPQEELMHQPLTASFDESLFLLYSGCTPASSACFL